MSRRLHRVFLVLAAAAALLAAGAVAGAQSNGGPMDRRTAPDGLVVDVRLFEARSRSPDFARLRDLELHVATDGVAVTAERWLGLLARNIPESFLAALAWETVPVEDARAVFRLDNPPRRLEASFDLAGLRAGDAVVAPARIALLRAGRPLRVAEAEVELALGRTTIFTRDGLELTPSEYLSHFRRYRDGEHRARLYRRLRGFVFHLVVAASLRPAPAVAPPARRRVDPPSSWRLPPMDNPLGVELFGPVRIAFRIAEDGTVHEPQIVRSAVPEANPRLLGEIARWRYDPSRTPPGPAEVVLEVVVPAESP